MYNKNCNLNSKVGCLHLGKVYCWSCIDKVHSDNDGHEYATVYLVNILPYSQHCALCKKVIVQGAEIDLFD